MHSINRRRFLQHGSAAFAACTVPSLFSRSAEAQPVLAASPAVIPGMEKAQLQLFAQAALDAAKKGGATYADVVFTHTHREKWDDILSSRFKAIPSHAVTMSAGVRALYKGYWGFTGLDGLMTADIMTRLGSDAAVQATYAAQGTPRTFEWAPAPVVPDGVWTMPVEIDPFTVSNDEKIDYFMAIADAIERERIGATLNGLYLTFMKEERLFASSEGSFIRQTSINSESYFSVKAEKHYVSRDDSAHAIQVSSAVGAGWEFFLNTPIRDRIAVAAEHAMRGRHGKRGEIGRFDVVFDAASMADMLSKTIGPATELDRAYGYEANGVGTSFLTVPIEMIGTYKIGSPLVNVSSTRSLPGGASTTSWDDDGVVPRDALLVKDGILHDFQTTRESASWLAPYYRTLGVPVQSNGCAGRIRASAPPTHRAPNLVMASGKDNTTFADLVASTKRGYAMISSYQQIDQQALNGFGRGLMYEIQDGKLGEAVIGGGYLFRTPEFWKNVVGIGGGATAENFGNATGRGERYDYDMYRMNQTIRAVPAKITNMTMIDPRRRI
jgi:TldD protein